MSFSTSIDSVSTYTITATVDNPNFGTITPAGETIVEEGGSVTYTITPFETHRISDVLVNEISQGEITTYTFENVQADGTIHAVFGSVGIYDFRFYDLRVYPNPTTGQLTITNYELGITNVEIFDMVGKKIQSKIVNLKSKIELDISHLANGIYFLRVDGKMVKVVKQ